MLRARAAVGAAERVQLGRELTGGLEPVQHASGSAREGGGRIAPPNCLARFEW